MFSSRASHALIEKFCPILNLFRADVTNYPFYAERLCTKYLVLLTPQYEQHWH